MGMGRCVHPKCTLSYALNPAAGLVVVKGLSLCRPVCPCGMDQLRAAMGTPYLSACWWSCSSWRAHIFCALRPLPRLKEHYTCPPVGLPHPHPFV